MTLSGGDRMYGGSCEHATLRMLVHVSAHAQRSSWQCPMPCGCTITLTSHEPAPDSSSR